MMNLGTKLNGLALLILTWFLLTITCLAQIAPPDQQIVGKVDKYMNALSRLNRFNGSILVARDGKVLVRRNYGVANLEDNIPNTPQTRFHLASITKQFTATAILMLQERGKLNVQDPICKYLADCPAAWQQITIHHLLTHSSGIPNFTDFPDWLQTRALPSTFASTVLRFKDKPLDFQPGEKYNYSNSGYILLGHIIEKISGRTYEGFLRDSIFVRLRMLNTGYDDNKVGSHEVKTVKADDSATVLTVPHIGYRACD
jgi:CubicO group peptidase (beta-lactamase class C family)